MRYLQVFFGGAAGSLLRYMVGILIASRYPGRFPLGTFLINVSGSFLIGVALQGVGPGWRPLLTSGFLGGYTTFSAFEWEIFATVQSGFPWLGAGYAIGSVAAGYLACWAGAQLIHLTRQ